MSALFCISVGRVWGGGEKACFFPATTEEKPWCKNIFPTESNHQPVPHVLLVSNLFSFLLQERVSAKQPPSYYLTKLRVYLDPTASKSSKVCDVTRIENAVYTAVRYRATWWAFSMRLALGVDPSQAWTSLKVNCIFLGRTAENRVAFVKHVAVDIGVVVK